MYGEDPVQADPSPRPGSSETATTRRPGRPRRLEWTVQRAWSGDQMRHIIATLTRDGWEFGRDKYEWDGWTLWFHRPYNPRNPAPPAGLFASSDDRTVSPGKRPIVRLY